MKKKIIVGGFIFLLVLIMAIFAKYEYKKIGLGNNISNSVDILNISSYEAIMDITVYSNKNTNRYLISEVYHKENRIQQEVLEPSSLKGIVITSDGENVTIENKRLQLKSLYENVSTDLSNLSLISLIQNYQIEGKLEENEEEMIMKTKITNTANPYQMYQNLYISKSSNLPVKMEILDRNENVTVYILYNEIKINETSKK